MFAIIAGVNARLTLFCLLTAGASLLLGPALAAEPRHGLSAFGDLKYGADFQHFDYVDPQAPKGGALGLAATGSFDNLNPFILKGIRFRGMANAIGGLPFESLMAGSADEPDAMYGLVAATAELASDRSWVEFTLRPEARWHDGSAISADDVVFSFHTLKTEGAPSFRITYRDIEKVAVTAPGRVRFSFRPGGVWRDLPLLAGSMPLISKAYYAKVEFNKTTVQPPLGSGPYRITKVDQGRSVTLERVADYWARDLPVNRGRYNFQTIRFDFYRDRNVEFEAFKAHEYDFREEFTSKVWATSYKFPAVKKGLVVVETVPDASPANRQNFMLNLRRAKFQDRGVRQAFDLAFDFEWINKNLFYGLYSRTLSVYQNTSMAARDLPGPAELALLEPHRAGLPAEVFSQIYQPPKSDGLGNNRRNLRQAAKLLSAAGWRIEDGRRVNAAGQAFELEFLTFSPTFERVYAPIVRNLKKLGIRATIRVVDSAQYANRMQEFDFDVSTTAFGGQTTPGVGERTFWGSEAANSPGSINYAGIADPVVDDLVARIAAAQTRPELETAARALDRVLLWNQYLIPQWFRAFHPIAYWDRFSRPATKPKYGLGFLDTWWHDTDKAARLAAKAKR